MADLIADLIADQKVGWIQSPPAGRTSTNRWRPVLWLALAGWSCLLTVPEMAHGQWLKKGMHELESPYLDGVPFDLLILNDSGDNAVLKVRPPAQPFPTSVPTAGMYLFEYTDGERLQVPFSSVLRYRTFNDLLIDEANRWLSEGKHAMAMRNLLYVYDRGGKSNPAVVESLQRCLFEDALQNLNSERFEFALTIFEDLHQRDPNFKVPGINRRLIEIIIDCHDGLIRQDFEADDYGSVGKKIQLIAAKYRKDAEPLVEKWQQIFTDRASELQRQAVEEAAAGNGRMAHLRSRQAEQIKPGDPETRKLQIDILKQYPLIVIGTTQPGAEADGLKIEHWGSRRVGRLVHRAIVELVGSSEEGGRYSFLNGNLTQIDERGLVYAFDVTVPDGRFGIPPATPYQIASRLLAASDPSSPVYNPGWQKILNSVQIDGGKVIVRLRVPFVKPEPLLRVPFSDPFSDRKRLSTVSTSQTESTVSNLEMSPALTRAESPESLQNGAYHWVDQESRSTTFELNPEYSPLQGHQHPVLIEQLYRSSSAAVDDLIRGNIDVVDRVPPGDLERLKRTNGIVVRPYSIPTVHFLVPKIRGDMTESPFLKAGLSHAIDRATLLHRAICNGNDIAGCEVLSGPFPSGIQENEQLGYGYDARIHPPFYSTQMASVLVDMALIVQGQAQAKKLEEERQRRERQRKLESQQAQAADPASSSTTEASENEPGESDTEAGESKDEADEPGQRNTYKAPVPHLVLAHPSSSTATEAARVIAAAWTDVGVPTDTLALAPDQAVPPHDDWDFLYVEMAIEEPLTDVMKVVGRDGLATEVSSVVEQTLQRLAFASSWRSSANSLRRLHRQMSIDLTVIPLFQIKEHYAYRNTVTGIGRSVIHLYQNVERWKIDVVGSEEDE